MPPTEVVAAFISLVGVVLSVYVNWRLGKMQQDAKSESEMRQLGSASEVELREDLFKTIELQRQDQKAQQEKMFSLEAAVEAERVKRRMQEDENDRLLRKITRLEQDRDRDNHEKDSRIRQLEIMVAQLQQEIQELKKERETRHAGNEQRVA